MNNSSKNPICSFCGSSSSYRYKMREYLIWQCDKCKTGFVRPMPDEEFLKKFYDGFIQNFNLNQIGLVKESAKRLFSKLGLKPGENLKMLDIGGGGGFFSKAFEDLKYGESTYVDLDPRSCNFASEHLRLKKVFNCDATKVSEIINDKFDFIYCRHVIEHLSSPTDFLRAVLKNLCQKGIFVVQFPNGNSLEYLAYPELNLKKRFQIICKTNSFSKLKTLKIMLTGGMLHGIDPPRHLWAITRMGMMKWAQNAGIICKISTHPLWDKAFSPYYIPAGIKKKFQALLGRYFFAKILGGTHLVALLRFEN